MSRGRTRSRNPSTDFRRIVDTIVAQVPRGKVVTYGQLAILAGRPRAARLVGWLAHGGPSDLPWQRVVNRFGGLARGYTGGRYGQRIELERDGVVVRDDGTVDLARYQWWPPEATLRRVRRSAGLQASRKMQRGR